MTLLSYVGLGAASIASALLITDYIRLRHNEYIEARAAKVAVALSGTNTPPATTAKCTDTYCDAFRSSVCADGRCRYHCRGYCHCKGNQ